MKTTMTVEIALDTMDEAVVERFEQQLMGWLSGQGMVEKVAVLPRGELNTGAWRKARGERFGSRLPNPFGQ